MSIVQVRLNVGVQRGTSGGPTSARRMIYNGRGELAHQAHLRPYPIHRYRFDFGKKLLAEADEVRSAFYIMLFGDGGPYDGILARDWNDYELTQDNSALVDIGGDQWQVCRMYRLASYFYARPIYRPAFDGALAVWRNRGGSITPASASISNDTGRGTVSDHVAGDTYTVEGLFDIALTFEADDALASVALGGNIDLVIQALGEIDLIEVPPEPSA